MNLRQLLPALPWLRRLWRFLPGPLRLPLLAVGAVVWLWRRARGEDQPAEDGEG